jgi:hypothetical protein
MSCRKHYRWLGALLAVFAWSVVPGVVVATDVDGPDDCIQASIDEGDAPEGMPAYATGVLGRFPTCIAFTPPGTQEFACPPISSPPGPTGYMEHFQYPGLPPFWLGCYPALGPVGFDNDVGPGGSSAPKVSVGFPAGSAAPPISACAGIPIDCVETSADGLNFGQDECYSDGSDAGITSFKTFVTCGLDAVTFRASSCPSAVQQRVVILNILVDWNADGDWNDNFQCPGAPGCAYEWAVKNAPITLVAGCNTLVSPSFRTGPRDGPGWLRISLTKDPVPDDYPWAGAALDGGGAYEGGETEDYPVMIGGTTSIQRDTWGNVKQLYR